MELDCKIQQYAWGKVGKLSKVAVLYQGSNPNFEIDNVPYAEMWMGTHPNGPSHIKNTKEPLSLFISHDPSNVLGTEVLTSFGNNLPFLLKILSVNKALSIQAHPEKSHAETLHKERPDLYKDSNHKPELAIALTDFEALCGFRPLNEIQTFLKEIVELRNLVGEENVNNLVLANENNELECLKKCFKSLMLSREDDVSNQLNLLLKRLLKSDETIRKNQLAFLIERLAAEFHNDIGCFVVYFLNHIILKPNEAIYLGPNVPHAYLYGDCVECMACSDNVVRAGLTPKYKDVETLCDMLLYKGIPVENTIFKSIKENEYTVIYKPPVPDFAVVKVELPKAIAKASLIKRKSASIFIVVSGKASMESINLKPGTVIFVPANTEINISNIEENILLFQAIANI